MSDKPPRQVVVYDKRTRRTLTVAEDFKAAMDFINDFAPWERAYLEAIPFEERRLSRKEQP